MAGFKVKPKNKKFILEGEFDKIIADWDTPLYTASKSVQEDYILVRYKGRGKAVEFTNQTEFWGHWKKKEGGWLKKRNEEQIEKGLKPFDPLDFEIEECARLHEGIDPMKEAMEAFDREVGKLKKAIKADDYILCIGGEGNFRYGEAHIQPYKGNRKEKPLFFQELKEAVITKYKNHIEVVDEEEADDRLGQYGRENYQHYKKTGRWKYVLAYLDKDLDMIISPSFNYSNIEAGITYTTEFEAAKAFCVQLLCGDKSVDNIQGIGDITKELREKYGLAKRKGVGKATAIDFLKGCRTIKELFGRVVEAYKAFYEKPITFVSHRGEEKTYSWLDFMQENAILLFMRQEKDQRYSVKDTLDKLGIEYG